MVDEGCPDWAGSPWQVEALIAAAVITSVASTLTYRLVEAPALRLKFRRAVEAPEPVPAAQIEAAP
jgi:peptidoglycan/LPS O-acetylase OafA/YrhL